MVEFLGIYSFKTTTDYLRLLVFDDVNHLHFADCPLCVSTQYDYLENVGGINNKKEWCGRNSYCCLNCHHTNR